MSNFPQQISDRCTTCPIFNRIGCRAVLPYSDLPNPKYLFIGEAPGSTEEAEGKPFVGKSGQVLRDAIIRAGIDIHDCAFSNASLCAPRPTMADPIGTPTQEEASHCAPHTLLELENMITKPAAVVVVGGVALRAFTGESSVTANRGRLLPILTPPFDVLYTEFRKWWKAREKSDDPLVSLWETDFDLKSDQLAALHQYELAKERLGFRSYFDDLKVFVLFHPSYVMRQGMEGESWNYFNHDLKSIRNKVENIVETKPDLDYKFILNIEDWAAYVNETIRMYQSGELECISCDIETTEFSGESGRVGLNPFDIRNRILSIQFSRRPKESVILLVNRQESVFNDPVLFHMMHTQLKRLLETVPVVGQNFTFDALNLRTRFGIMHFKVVGDTMLMEHWLSMGKDESRNLNILGIRYVGGAGHKVAAHDWFHQNPGKGFDDLPMDLLLEYAGGDADITLQVYYKQREKLQKEGRWQAYYDFYHGKSNNWQVIFDLDYYGMPVDKEALDRLQESYPKRMEACLVEFHKSPFVIAWMESRRQEWNKESEAYNATILPNSKKRPRRTFQPHEWRDVRDNWLNPGSWVHIQDLWVNIMKIPFKDMTDLDLKEQCATCAKSPKQCKCQSKYLVQVPQTNNWNRTIILEQVHKWKARLEKDLMEWCKEPEKHQAEIESGMQDFGVWTEVISSIELLSQYKKMDKMYGTYVAGIYPLIIDKPGPDEPWDPKERCFPLYKNYCEFPRPWSVHPIYHMDGTDTGRLSSSDPNGQNFPKFRMEKGANVKDPYISAWRSMGGIIIQPDYSQIEVRVMVCEAGEQDLAKAINDGRDIHTYVTSRVYSIPEDQVSDDLRTPTKTITFGILYGKTVPSLAYDLKITVEDAQKLQNDFFSQMPLVKNFIKRQHKEVEETGGVNTRFGRFRYLPHVYDEKKGRRNKALRDAVNTPIQSEASDLCWSAFSRINAVIKETELTAVPYAIIHDSQAFDTYPGHWFDLINLMYYQMVFKPYELYDWVICKPDADFEMGAGWGHLVKVKLKFDKEGGITHEIDLRGKPDDIRNLMVEILNGGDTFDIIVDGPHPKKKEAEAGMWQTVIKMTPKTPICRLRGRGLDIYNNGVLSSTLGVKNEQHNPDGCIQIAG